ncbi:cytochrome P450 736A117 [Beta vulgaris subsp. vulgaris]|uniref:cytochrome P450 736A117 n=1 Tax=Beta vulgaris subsp. vulgaris TaxID=3555 RepID=UPI002547446F|nr:cytochrome P450 736A117 [Beta vulgaris subsp. vulgaris]
MFTSFLQFLQTLIFYPFLLPFLLFALLFLYYNTLSSSTSTTKNQPPSPPKLPIIGNLHQIGPLPRQSFSSLSHQYGHVMLLHFGSKPTLVISSADVAKEIMKTHDLLFCSRPRSLVTNKIFYGCKDMGFSPYGEHWRMMKSICVMQLLSNKKVQSYRKIREEEVGLIMEMIKKSKFSVVDLSEIIMTQTYDLICRATFGRKYSGKDEDGIDFKELLLETMELLGVFSFGDFIPWLSWMDRIKGLTGRVERVAKELDQLLDKVIQENKNRLKNKKSMNDVEFDDEGKSAKNFVEILLESKWENEVSLPMDDIKAVILDVFAAGADTTYTLLEWTMTELIRHPRVMKELQEEVRKIIACKGNSVLKVSEDDLDKLTYLKAVLKETLRLHPPAPLLVFRESLKDVKIDGFDIKAGTHVFINAWEIHRDPTFWEEPEEFRPERFLNDSSLNFKGQDFNYIPFGAGRRSCPGISFAMVNAELMLANLVYEFDWKMPENGVLDMDESVGITVHRRVPLVLIPTPYYS